MHKLKMTDILNEKLWINRLSNGMHCYIIPKKDYVEKQAVISINYGSVDTSFEINDKMVNIPDGAAHFLEHKLFEDEEKNIFDAFTKQGGQANAFTNFNTTAYYFRCSENFTQNLKLLLEFTATPYFTDENVEKEKGIITQEIKMYEDNPCWRAFLNMQKEMYSSYPVYKNISGSAESVAQMTADILIKCYNAFYCPNNMALICVGDVEPDLIYALAEEKSSYTANKAVKKQVFQEPPNVKNRYVEEKMSMSQPLFKIGFKDNDIKMPIAERIVSSRLLMDIVAGESSDFFYSLYDKGLLSNPFGMEYMGSNAHGTAIFSGASDDPVAVNNSIMEQLRKLKEVGINNSRFEQIKKKHIGRYIRSFNVIDNIATGQADLFSKGIDLFDLINAYKAATVETIQNRLLSLLDENISVLSVIKPLDETVSG